MGISYINSHCLSHAWRGHSQLHISQQTRYHMLSHDFIISKAKKKFSIEILKSIFLWYWYSNQTIISEDPKGLMLPVWWLLPLPSSGIFHANLIMSCAWVRLLARVLWTSSKRLTYVTIYAMSWSWNWKVISLTKCRNPNGNFVY